MYGQYIFCFDSNGFSDNCLGLIVKLSTDNTWFIFQFCFLVFIFFHFCVCIFHLNAYLENVLHISPDHLFNVLKKSQPPNKTKP